MQIDLLDGINDMCREVLGLNISILVANATIFVDFAQSIEKADSGQDLLDSTAFDVGLDGVCEKFEDE